MATKMKMYQALARTLVDNDISTIFGLMGDANLFMTDEFISLPQTRFLPAVYEGNAVGMAHGFSTHTGQIGIATVTHGPALTNCVTSLTEAARANAPVVLMAGDTPTANPQHLQSTEQKDVADLCGAGFIQIRSPQTAAEDLARAIYLARSELRPILFNMPAEFMWEEVEYEKTVHPVFASAVFADEGQWVDEAIGMIASAKRPLILAGQGAIDSKDQLVKLADRLEAPLATTLKAKDLFREHPFYMGICGTLSTPAGYDAIDKTDCIIAFGASLNEWTTDHGKLFAGKRLVQVDTRPGAIGKTIHPTAALIGDAGRTADNIMFWLDEAEIPASGFTKELDPEKLKRFEEYKPEAPAKDKINYMYALEWFDQNLPAERIIATDGGRFMTEVWCRVSAPTARDFLDTVSFGSVGLGMQQALGAGVASPDRPVVLFTGDGGFMMGGVGEFHTALRENLDLIVVICNDAAYGAEHIQMIDKQIDPKNTTFNWPSFAQVAEGFGAIGVEVKSEADLETVKTAIDSRDRPVIIDLHLDPFSVPRMRT